MEMTPVKAQQIIIKHNAGQKVDPQELEKAKQYIDDGIKKAFIENTNPPEEDSFNKTH